MSNRSLWAIALTMLCVPGCRTATAPGAEVVRPVRPGAPGESARPTTPAAATDLSQFRVTDADVRFMQGMIGHHAQAVDMVALVPSRTTDPQMLALARRIDVSQADEIAMMQHWLRAHGQEAPGADAMHVHGAVLMPGMLTPEEMTQLAAATGSEFVRLFLRGMIKHHGGALTMVEALFATPGAGQDSDIYAFASDVDADQRMEIIRMSRMLEELSQ
ncbi:MAG: DUF305 domain-containing protein [Acidobacteria bacterium]|nr:DUF305 domain-containing protein [Acidobacteriota bacterium]